MVVQVGKNFAGAFQGQDVVVVELGGLGFQARTILNRLVDLRGKLSLGLLTTLRTMFDFGLVFRHFYPHRRQIKHLSFLISFNGHADQ
jgi:hypothetical protein